MAKPERDVVKRKIAQIWYHCEVSLEYIESVEHIFRPVHPDYADGLLAAAGLIIPAQQIIEKFAELAWNLDKERLSNYRR